MSGIGEPDDRTVGAAGINAAYIHIRRGGMIPHYQMIKIRGGSQKVIHLNSYTICIAAPAVS
jgi:hypothetical protein